MKSFVLVAVAAAALVSGVASVEAKSAWVKADMIAKKCPPQGPNPMICEIVKKK